MEECADIRSSKMRVALTLMESENKMTRVEYGGKRGKEKGEKRMGWNRRI
jgi:hypothetical protein